MTDHVARARECAEDALRAIDAGVLGEAWMALEDAQRALIKAEDADALKSEHS